MKIAVLTSGILPIPAVKGGAVENLVDFYLEYNERQRLHDITVYSVGDSATAHHPTLKSSINHYLYIDTTSLIARTKRYIYGRTNSHGYYNYLIDYFFEKALKHIEKCHYDVIILENRPGYACRLAERTDARLVLHLHNDLLNNSTRLGHDIYNSLSRILCVSDYIAGRVRSIDAQSTKTLTVHNGIDTVAFSHNSNANAAINRSTLHIEDNDFVLIFCGRVIKEKGIVELIEAMNMLKQYKDIKLLILGNGFVGEENSVNSLLGQLTDMTKDIADRICFTGFVPYDKVPHYLRMADVAIIPSVWHDPFPTSVLEAQAAGKPIIATASGGINEEVDSDNAIIVPLGDGLPARLADAILQLYNDPAMRSRMSAHSLERAPLFTKDKYAAHFFEAIASCDNSINRQS